MTQLPFHFAFPVKDLASTRGFHGGLLGCAPPSVRYQGKPSEQASTFLLGPSGNALELKAFRNPHAVDAR